MCINGHGSCVTHATRMPGWKTGRCFSGLEVAVFIRFQCSSSVHHELSGVFRALDSERAEDGSGCAPLMPANRKGNDGSCLSSIAAGRRDVFMKGIVTAQTCPSVPHHG